MNSSLLSADTVAAIATAQGRGAVAMLRVSGPGASDVLRRVAPALGDPQPRVQRLAAIRHPESGELLDRGLVTWFPAPQSYTGQDTVEIATHGGVLTPQLVLDALFAAGARPAQPGEFTRRAYLNGRLDLLQAEAVADLIDGRSPALHRAAVNQMERGLSRRISDLRDAVIGTEALIAYSIDFPEEDEPPIPPARIRASALDVSAQLDALLRTAPEGELLREGALTVLAGRPNAGKSSLFNALLGMERAIVTDIPGTTRDALESALSIRGYPFRLVDTAGLRETVDVVEGMGIEVARRYLSAADIVLVLAEVGRELDDDERAFLASLPADRTLLVRTKADQLNGVLDDDGSAIHVSTATGAGLPELRGALLRTAFGAILGEPAEAPLVTRERHARALRTARDEIGGFVAALDDGVPMEFAATHLRAAAESLEDMVGAVSVDDVLDRVFGSFCVGK
ncbi:tRNA uridine-5-carboxymethylaminomethyl(34) synthesis GTPase MnmE [Longimicrobium terrae]|uniref:tRNA modification GTPase MnmE n=1 Tax=Longimicrobium terrae TaxID=1639882 RepID=A0A841GZM6_9BACT|nr:tRNA uridine-5-carboxymethylaminomethyl(34) synthesis GTPase MnmE [Longimicrobium terrae]MBB4636736.1 tRNA modification GTPase [Longimicrobium terrae]MBB6071265.1 tRNA modification GTPase [Longimicrobium terrae]NNC29311.1 tRNA uridine-5-carboxymethylaminomethyl(34) synthesis GTPase MnmE [Longimicrobium terrae]